MNSEFEEYLSRQSLRKIPSAWRAEILGAAQAKPVEAAPVRWWREWLWPCPRAWAGLAAAWMLVFLLHAAAPAESRSSAKVTPMTLQTFALLQHEMEMVAQLPDSIPASPGAPSPRSCRRVEQRVG